MKYNEFIHTIQNRARLTSSDEAERATRATLETLAERLQGKEVKDLFSQLPPEIGQYLQAQTISKGQRFSLDEFFQRVSEREGTELADADFHARVVLGLLAESVTMGEIADIRAQLPPEFAELLAVENEGEIPGLGKVADVEDENV